MICAARTARRNIDQYSIQRIAAYRALFLGDLVVALPAFRALKERFPHAQITLIGLPWAEDFVARTPYIDRLQPFPGYQGIMEVPYRAARTARFMAAARAYPYDLALQMHGDGSVSNGFVADLGARLSLGYRRDGDARLDMSLPYQDDEHEVARWLRLIEALNIAHADTVAAQCSVPPLATTLAENARADTLLAQAHGGAGPLVALHAGAKDPWRRWPPERFAALGEALAERCGARVVLTGSPGEREITQAVRQHMRSFALDLAGETDLGAFIALIARLDLLVTNDTGASHIASTTGTRSVVLFGPSRPAQWAPRNRELHRVVDALALAPAEVGEHAALSLLPVEPVLAMCEEILQNQESAAGPATIERVLEAGSRLTDRAAIHGFSRDV